jgi:hypothetical protein
LTVQPRERRFQRRYAPAYDGIAAADMDQEDREALARSVAARYLRAGAEDFMHDLFVLLASDPVVRCAGYDIDGERHECPARVEIRVRMHDSGAPDGRSTQWSERAPYGEVRCLPCGSRQHVRGFAANTQEAR